MESTDAEIPAAVSAASPEVSFDGVPLGASLKALGKLEDGLRLIALGFVFTDKFKRGHIMSRLRSVFACSGRRLCRPCDPACTEAGRYLID